MKSWKSYARILAILIALPLLASAGTVVDQGAGNASQKPWQVAVTAASVSAFTLRPPTMTTGAPLLRVAISTVNANTTGIVAGNYYRIACSTDVFFRWGAGAQTAVTTDTAFFGPGVEYLIAPAGATDIAFITAAGTGFCTITTLVP